MKKSTLVPTLLFAALLCASSYAQETYTLKYGFEKGKTYQFQETTNGVMTMELMGQEMKIPMEMESTSRLVVEDVAANKNISIIWSYDKFMMKVKSEMIDTSANVEQLVGKRKRTVIDPLGRVVSTDVIDTVETGDASTFVASTGFAPMLPEKPVAIGDTWTGTRTDNGTSLGKEGNMKSTITYTLAGKETRGGRDALKITYTGKVEMSGTANQMGTEVSVEGSGTVSGTAYFDPVKGMCFDETVKMDMNTVIGVSGQEAMSFTGNQVMNTSKKLIEN